MAIHDATIAIDFDGTVVTHAYPEIGEDAGAAPVLKELTDNGCRLILYSMRHGKLLDRAVEWFRVRGIPLYAVNENPSQKRWTSSPKIHADLYIDDCNLGCPLRFVDGEKHPVADWAKIREQLVREGFLDCRAESRGGADEGPHRIIKKRDFGKSRFFCRRAGAAERQSGGQKYTGGGKNRQR